MGTPCLRIASDVVLSRRGSTRATLYNWSSKILTHQGRTHVTWLDFLAANQIQTIVFGSPRQGDAELIWHDGEKWQARPLLEEVRRVRPSGFISPDGTLSFDREGGLYIALQTAREPKDWGGAGAEVVLLHSNDGGQTFTVLPVSAPGDSVPCWQPSLERVSSFHQETPAVPALTYTRGVKGTGCSSRDYTEVHFVTLEKLQ